MSGRAPTVDLALRVHLSGACVRCVGDDHDGCILGTRYRYAKEPPPNGRATTLGPCPCGCHRPTPTPADPLYPRR